MAVADRSVGNLERGRSTVKFWRVCVSEWPAGVLSYDRRQVTVKVEGARPASQRPLYTREVYSGNVYTTLVSVRSSLWRRQRRRNCQTWYRQRTDLGPQGLRFGNWEMDDLRSEGQSSLGETGHESLTTEGEAMHASGTGVFQR